MAATSTTPKPKGTKKKAPAVKKTAAPRKTKSSDTFSLSALFPVPVMQLALVAVADNRLSEMASRLCMDGDKIKKAAVLAHQLCSGDTCFFCGDTRREDQKTTHVTSESLCHCLAPLRTGYREHMPDWKRCLLAPHDPMLIGTSPDMHTTPSTLEALVRAGELRSDSPVYSDACVGCKGDFTITAGHIIGALHRHGAYAQQHRCRDCAATLSNRRAANNAAPAATKPLESKGEAPPAKKRTKPWQKHKQANTHSEGSSRKPDVIAEDPVPSQLVVSLGDLIQSKSQATG